MTFLCDAMLVRLGRWLRAAGHDTEIMEHRRSDRALVSRAVAEGRTILTRDRKILEFRDAPGRTVWLRGNRVEEWVAEITPRLGVDWLARPFSRCLLCNGALAAAPPALHGRLPERARALGGPVTYCRRCDKLYWPGSHLRRMRARLAAWQAGDFS